jgi:peptidoglycan/LPS O-acetylase OafA/YrhL
MQRLRYEEALDGLRAVAVLAVLLYHAEVAWLPGGFLGVEVFFALSGYLITTLLLRERRDTGRIDLPEFWRRRARRLLPALVLVLVAVALYAAVLAESEELRRIRGDGLAALLYVANWWMIVDGGSYFEQFAAPSPLRHLWSLGIEEQWYLLWPLVLGLLLRMRRLLLPVLLTGAFASAVVMAILYEPGDPSRAYFGTDARVQGLLLGAALAVVLTRSPAWVPALGTAGLAVLTGLFLIADGTASWLYRGGFALCSAATVAAVAAAVAPAGPVRRLLGAGPLPAVGRVSYGLYLWHWPVYVVLTPARSDLDGAALLAVRLAATFALAGLSYRLVEQPLRAGRVPLLALPPAVGATAVLLVIVTLGASVPSATTAAARPPTPAAEIDIGPARVLVVGDSVALTLSGDRPAGVPGPDIQITSEAILGCGVIRVNRHAGPFVHEPSDDCRAWPEIWAAAITRLRPDVTMLLLGAWEAWDIQLDGERIPYASARHEALLREEVNLALDVLSVGRTEVLVLTTPCFNHFDAREFREGSDRNDPARVAWINGMLRQAATGRGDVRVVDLGGWLCPGGRFQESIDGVQVRDHDGVHLESGGLGVVWDWLRPDVLSAARRARS